DRFPVSRARRSLQPGLPKIGNGLVPDLALSIVHTESLEVRLEILRVYLLEGSSNSCMEKLAVRRQDAVPSDLADSVVSEVDALSDPVENATPHKLLDTFSRATNAETSGDL